MVQRDCLGLYQIDGYDAAGNGRPVVLVGARAVTTWRISSIGAKRSMSVDLSRVADEDRKIVQDASLAWANKIGCFLAKS